LKVVLERRPCEEQAPSGPDFHQSLITLALVVFQDVALIIDANLDDLFNINGTRWVHTTHQPRDLFEKFAIITTALSKVIRGDENIPSV
jgi:hypothetical protein